MANRRGMLLILSSPSGAGKSTLSRKLMAWNPEMVFSVSATTRAPRKGEVDGQDYWFKTDAEFKQMVEKGEMLEHAEVFGHFYGSPLGPVEAALDAGKDVIFDIDWQGGDQIRASKLASDVVSVFVLPPSIAALETRLQTRAQDSAEVVAKRMSQAKAEISHWQDYDYLIENDDLDQAFATLQAIVLAERNKRQDMGPLVSRLNAEFEARK